MQIAIWMHISPSSPRRAHIQLGHLNPVFWHHQLFTMYCYYVTARNRSSTFTRALLPPYMISVSFVCCKKKMTSTGSVETPWPQSPRTRKSIKSNKMKNETDKSIFINRIMYTSYFFSIGTNSRLIICSKKRWKGKKCNNKLLASALLLLCRRE